MGNVLNMLTGYKTYLAGLSAILTGLAQMANVAPDALAQTTPHGWALVLFGLGLIGLGHKTERLIQTVQTLLAATEKK